jgi:hypothetical protein
MIRDFIRLAFVTDGRIGGPSLHWFPVRLVVPVPAPQNVIIPHVEELPEFVILNVAVAENHGPPLPVSGQHRLVRQIQWRLGLDASDFHAQ